jgi:hypothetical protein
MEMTTEKLFVEIPLSDEDYLKEVANEKGWKVRTRQDIWDEYAKTCPTGITLSDKAIMAEVRLVRYGEAIDPYEAYFFDTIF